MSELTQPCHQCGMEHAGQAKESGDCGIGCVDKLRAALAEERQWSEKFRNERDTTKAALAAEVLRMQERAEKAEAACSELSGLINGHVCSCECGCVKYDGIKFAPIDAGQSYIHRDKAKPLLKVIDMADKAFSTCLESYNAEIGFTGKQQFNSAACAAAQIACRKAYRNFQTLAQLNEK